MRCSLDSALDRMADYPPGFRYPDLEDFSLEFFTAEALRRGEEKNINHRWTQLNTDKRRDWFYLMEMHYLWIVTGIAA